MGFDLESYEDNISGPGNVIDRVRGHCKDGQMRILVLSNVNGLISSGEIITKCVYQEGSLLCPNSAARGKADAILSLGSGLDCGYLNGWPAVLT